MTARVHAEEPPRPPRPIVLRKTTRPLARIDHHPPRGLELRFARELDWTRLVLSEDGPGLSLLGHGGSLLRPSLVVLPGLDLQQEFWQSTPYALGSVASAASSFLTEGFSMLEVRRGGKLRQRHAISMYFRRSGANLAWRIEF